MGWSQEQIRNAGIIYQTGKSLGMSSRDIQIGIITAMVESNLVNVNYGDRDSLGLFQQRPSQGWGTPEQVTDPRYAAQKFFTTLQELGDRRWQMGMGEAAQAVQRSAFPDRYAERIADMRAIWPRVATAAGEQPTDMDGDPYGALDKPEQESIPEALMATPELDMLGEWSMPKPAAPEVLEAPRTIISPATNETVIKPLAEETGPYTKGVDGWRKAVTDIAQQYLGTPYVWGGTSPGGFDCSGLLQYVYQQVGINLPRVSYQQARAGAQVDVGDLRPGDLVAWDNSSRNSGADHIAMYVGDGRILEAPRSGLSVRIRKLGDDEGAWGVRLNG